MSDDDGDVVLRTPLCPLLGCRFPIVLAPMGGVGTPALVAAVTNAGGFGILPGMGAPPDELRARIREVRRLTDRPFGVNVILHPDVRSPVSASDVRGAAEAHAVLDGFRDCLGLVRPPAKDPPSLAIDRAMESSSKSGRACSASRSRRRPRSSRSGAASGTSGWSRW